METGTQIIESGLGRAKLDETRIDPLFLKEIADVPPQYKVLKTSDGDEYEVFAACKAKHLIRGANEAATLFATRKSDKEKVAIKIFLGAQTGYPEVRAAEFRRAIEAIPEAERTMRLEDSEENRAYWEKHLINHVFSAGTTADLMEGAFTTLTGGPAVSLAAMELAPENQLTTEGYGFISVDGMLHVTKSGKSPKVFPYEKGHPVLVTKFVEGKLLFLDEAAESETWQPSKSQASREVYLKYKDQMIAAKQKIADAGFAGHDVEVFVNPETEQIYVMDLGQIKPMTIEAIKSCIDKVVKIYNLPEIFVKMAANRYWHKIEE